MQEGNLTLHDNWAVSLSLSCVIFVFVHVCGCTPPQHVRGGERTACGSLSAPGLYALCSRAQVISLGTRPTISPACCLVKPGNSYQVFS